MFDHCLYFNAGSLNRMISRVADDAFRETGLHAPGAYALKVIAARPRITIKELAMELALAPSTASRFVETLALRGLVIRHRTPSDGRLAELEVTESGRALGGVIDRCTHRLYERLRDALGQATFDSLVGSVRQARALLDPTPLAEAR